MIKKSEGTVHIKQQLSVSWSKSGTQLGKECIISFHFADVMTQRGGCCFECFSSYSP